MAGVRPCYSTDVTVTPSSSSGGLSTGWYVLITVGWFVIVAVVGLLLWREHRRPPNHPAATATS
jgi:hypothetical protein